MDSPNDRLPFSMPETRLDQHAIDSSSQQNTVLPVRTDRLYQIAAVAAGIILLATAL